jgi:hypothetical protein
MWSTVACQGAASSRAHRSAGGERGEQEFDGSEGGVALFDLDGGAASFGRGVACLALSREFDAPQGSWLVASVWFAVVEPAGSGFCVALIAFTAESRRTPVPPRPNTSWASHSQCRLEAGPQESSTTMP